MVGRMHTSKWKGADQQNPLLVGVSRQRGWDHSKNRGFAEFIWCWIDRPLCSSFISFGLLARAWNARNDAFNANLKEGIFLSCSEEARFALISKGHGPIEETSVYRPLCRYDTAVHMLENIIRNKLIEAVYPVRKLSSGQFGFRARGFTSGLVHWAVAYRYRSRRIMLFVMLGVRNSIRW